jgi:hypothetical protein
LEELHLVSTTKQKLFQRAALHINKKLALKSMSEIERLAPLFERIGLTQIKAKETAGNKKIAPLLEKAILSVGLFSF